MYPTYPGTLRDGQIVWDGDAPPNIPVRVLVTVMYDGVIPATGRGAGMAAALECLAARGFGATIPDPVAWQREMREDRPLPGRDEESSLTAT